MTVCPVRVATTFLVATNKDNLGQYNLNVTNLFDKDYASGCQGLLVCSYGEGRKALLKAHVTW